MSAQWEETFNQFNGKKIVTLSESGTLPVMDKVTKYGTWWSYFSLWTGDFIRSYPQDDVREAYLHSLVINAEDLPDWKNFIVSTEQSDFLPSSINVSFYPNPFNPITTLKIFLKTSTSISIELFSVLGKSVMKMEKHGLSLGENYIRLDAGELNSGVYLVKITANAEVFVKKITLLK
jgi:mannan endo-1,4-beta-mannosidase